MMCVCVSVWVCVCHGATSFLRIFPRYPDICVFVISKLSSNQQDSGLLFMFFWQTCRPRRGLVFLWLTWPRSGKQERTAQVTSFHVGQNSSAKWDIKTEDMTASQKWSQGGVGIWDVLASVLDRGGSGDVSSIFILHSMITSESSTSETLLDSRV